MCYFYFWSEKNLVTLLVSSLNSQLAQSMAVCYNNFNIRAIKSIESEASH